MFEKCGVLQSTAGADRRVVRRRCTGRERSRGADPGPAAPRPGAGARAPPPLPARPRPRAGQVHQAPGRGPCVPAEDRQEVRRSAPTPRQGGSEGRREPLRVPGCSAPRPCRAGLGLPLLLHRPRGLVGPGGAALLQPPARARVQAGARVGKAWPEAGERVAARRALLLHRVAHRLPRAAARPRRALLGVLADVDHDDVALEVHHLPAGNKRGVTVSSHISCRGRRREKRQKVSHRFLVRTWSCEGSFPRGTGCSSSGVPSDTVPKRRDTPSGSFMCQLTRRAAAEEGGGEKAKEKQDCGPCSSFVVCHAGLTTGRRAQQVSGCNRCGRYLGKGVRAAIPRHHTDSGLAAVGCISEGVRCWREGYCLIGPWSPGAQPPL